MDNNKIHHLEMIEKIIDRMAQNSFKLKGWAVTLITIVGAFSYQCPEKWCSFIALGLMPLIVFWFLDSYYLQLERQYRVLYNLVTLKNDCEVDFCMDLNKSTYSFQEAQKICFMKCLFSKTELFFYGSLIVAFFSILLLPTLSCFKCQS